MLPDPVFTVLLAAILLSVVAALLNFRFLLYAVIPRLNPAANPQELQLKGETLFISDLHLEVDRLFKYAKELRALIDARHVVNLVVNGDLFNSPEDATAILRNTAEGGLLTKLGLEDLSANLFWVIGSPPHDSPAIIEGRPSIGGFQLLGGCALARLGDTRILLYHGHDLSVKGAFGHGWDRFVSRLSLERAWKKSARVDNEIWVFFGHTHIPGIDLEHRVANSGGWQKVPFVKPTNTGLLMRENQNVPELVTIA